MSQAFDLLISGGTVIDGTGSPRFDADVGVRGDRIVFVGEASHADAASARQRIDAGGLIVAPGFIDCHTHDDRALLSAPDMSPKVSQGVTTVVTGNCGVSLAPTGQGLPRPTPAPLDLLDLEGGWFRFPSFGAYLERTAHAVRRRPTSRQWSATPPCGWSSWTGLTCRRTQRRPGRCAT